MLTHLAHNMSGTRLTPTTYANVLGDLLFSDAKWWGESTIPRTTRPARFLAADAWDATSHTVRDGRAIPALPEV